MITIRRSVDSPMFGVAHYDVYGLSTDTKPTEDITNSSTFFEMDTGNVFLFDEENKVWLQQ